MRRPRPRPGMTLAQVWHGQPLGRAEAAGVPGGTEEELQWKQFLCEAPTEHSLKF